MSKTTWADVKKHDVVELGDREYRVVKIKPKGKKATVMVEYKGRYSESKVKLSLKVKIVQRNGGSKKGPLADAEGNGRRWATKHEAEEVLGKGGGSIPAGNPKKTTPPAKPSRDPWSDPKPGVESMLRELIGARLVAETDDEKAGHYVPPVNVSTVAAHLVLFHGVDTSNPNLGDEGAMLKAHEFEHAAALRGEMVLAVNHWHTEKRPKIKG